MTGTPRLQGSRACGASNGDWARSAAPGIMLESSLGHCAMKPGKQHVLLPSLPAYDSRFRVCVHDVRNTTAGSSSLEDCTVQPAAPGRPVFPVQPQQKGKAAPGRCGFFFYPGKKPRLRTGDAVHFFLYRAYTHAGYGHNHIWCRDRMDRQARHTKKPLWKKQKKSVKIDEKQERETSMGNGAEKITLQQFELFKGNIRHMVKNKGQLGFIREMLTSGRIIELWEEGMDLYALYLLAMTDYLSKLNGIPLYAGYDELRRYKMDKKIYPMSIRLDAKIFGKDMDELAEDAIPEFLEYNIVEGDIFNAV